MTPATISNSKIYLGSFGIQNAGTGQFCLYGLLSSASSAKVAAPTGGKAEGSRGEHFSDVGCGGRSKGLSRRPDQHRKATETGSRPHVSYLHRARPGDRGA